MTARFTVVHPNCIRIEEAPFTSERSLFAVSRQPPPVTGRDVRLDTGAIRLRYRADGKPLSAHNLQAWIRHGKRWVTWQPGQHQTGNLGGTAHTLDNWVGAQAVPAGLLSRDGWFLLDDSTRPVLARGWARARREVGKDWYLFGYGADYRGAFQALAAIAGPVPLPRRCTLGAWYSRYWPHTAADYRRIVAEYERHGFPLDVVVMDMDWHINDARRAPGARIIFGTQVWTGYTWDRRLIPNPPALLAWLHRQGLKVTLNDHPADGVQPHEEMYRAFMRALGRSVAGRPTVLFDAGDREYLERFYDFTHVPREKEGVDFWWLDWQQRRETRSISELTNLEWLNHYYYRRSRESGKRGQSFSRWAGWGDHRHPIHFSGDAHSGWPMLAFEVPFTATAGNVGCFFWSHDIGGHQGGRNEESYVRWCQFGAVSAALRSHSTRSPEMDRRPWKHPAWACRSMKRSFRLRSELFPYIYTSVAQACRETFPFIRPMYLMEPKSAAAYRNPQQFMLGDHVLVAPITEPGVGSRRQARQVVWFPKGIWYNFFTGERFVGPQERLVAADIDEFPLYVRGGVPVPMQPYTNRMTHGVGKELIIRCWPGQSGASELYEDDGETESYRKGQCARTPLRYSRRGKRVRIEIGPTVGSFPGQVTERAVTIQLPGTRTKPIVLPAASIRIRRVVEVEVEEVVVPVRAVTGLFAKVESVTGYPVRPKVIFYSPVRTDQASMKPLPVPRDELHFGPVAQTWQAGRSRLTIQSDEPYWKFRKNVAPAARVTASSWMEDQPPTAAVDGVVAGIPGDRSREWASQQEKAGAWIRLDWRKPVKVGRVLLFDRPNVGDHIVAGRLELSDGSVWPVGELPADGKSPGIVTFPARRIRWLKFTVTEVSAPTGWVGLAELAVYAV